MICGSLVTDIISKMGGQCFFICKLPKIKALERKKGSKFDTTEEEKRAFYENNQDLFGRYHGDLFDYEDVRQIIEKRLREDAYDKLIQDILCQLQNRE